MTFTPFHPPGTCPACDAQRTQPAPDVPAARLRTASAQRRYFEATCAERWAAT